MQVCVISTPVTMNVTVMRRLGVVVLGGHVCRLQCVLGDLAEFGNSSIADMTEVNVFKVTDETK